MIDADLTLDKIKKVYRKVRMFESCLTLNVIMYCVFTAFFSCASGQEPRGQR